MIRFLHLLLILIAFPCFSQIEFQPGHYTDNAGAKHEGFIKNIEWVNNPEAIDFRETADGSSRTIKASEMTGFSVGDDVFRKFDIEVDVSPSETSQLTPNRLPVWKKETALLRKLSGDKLELYVYSNVNLVRFFMKTPDGTPEQLVYKEYLNPDNKIVKNLAYQQQLFQLFGGKPETRGKFERIAYDERSLKKIFDEYNGVENVKKKNGRKTKFKVKAVAGAAMMSAEYVSADMGRVDFGSQTVFSGGLELEAILPFNREKWAIFISPTYQAFSADAQKRATLHKLDYSSIDIAVGGRHYFFLGKELKLYAEVAMVANFNSGSFKLSYGNVDYVSMKLKDTFVAGLGAGLAYGRFQAGIRYTTDRSISKGPYHSLDVSALNLNASVKFL